MVHIFRPFCPSMNKSGFLLSASGGLPLSGPTSKKSAMIFSSFQDMQWPRNIGQNCHIQRTGVDKSRCYLAGTVHYSTVLYTGV